MARKKVAEEILAVSPQDIARWRAALARISTQMSALEAKRVQIEQLLKIGGALSAHDAAHVVSVRRKPKKQIKTISKPRNAPPARETWTAAILRIVQEIGGPASYKHIRQEIAKTSLAEKLRQSDKGLYGGAAKLVAAKKLLSYKGHLFTHKAYKHFVDGVAIGLFDDIASPNTVHASPLRDAIVDFLRNNASGETGPRMFAELAKSPALAVDWESSHKYNVLARLIKNGTVMKKGDRYFFAADKKEAPTGKPEEASVAGGADTPLFEGRSTTH